MLKPFAILYFSLVLAAGVLVGTGLVVDLEHLYSDSLGYRWQTQAFLEGRVALSEHPGDVAWDLAWANGGVQQVWGLGAPLWRLPFEAVTEWTGSGPFPDRIAFGIAVVAVFFLVIAVFAVPPRGAAVGAYWKQYPEGVCFAFLLMLFPPFLGLCRTRFLVYEEAAAYAYLTGVALLAGLVLFVRKPSLAGYLALCLIAGLAAFVRPTLVFYGGATVLTAGLWAWHWRWPLGKLALGAGAFAFAIGLLLVSNHDRFGSAMEFGHTINLNGIDPMRFATRFEAPFTSEPPVSAARELAGGLFFGGNRFNGFDSFAEDILPGQSATHRWREYYFTTYDLSYLLMLGIAWGWGIWWRVEGRRRKGEGEDGSAGVSPAEERAGCPRSDYATKGRAGCPRSRGGAARSEIGMLALWSAVAATGLFVFYLRVPVMSSRYLLDFGPAFGAVVGAFLFIVMRYVRGRFRHEGRTAMVFCAFFLVWWGWQVGTLRVADDMRGGRSVLTAEQVAARSVLDSSAMEVRHHSNGYRIGDSAEPGWPWLHLHGWNLQSGRTTAAAALFVPPLERLTLTVAPAEAAEVASGDYEIIRAKVGVEFLERESIEETPEGVEITFAGPRRKVYREGFQTAFLGFTTADELHDGESRFRLLKVEWDEAKNGRDGS